MSATTGRLGALVIVLCGLVACDRLPNLHKRDRLGEIPRFTWIEKGQPRPVPATAHATVGLEPRPDRQPNTRIGTSKGCWDAPDASACLRGNWGLVLNRLGEVPLTAQPGVRAYRHLSFVACGKWTSTTLYVSPSGSGVLQIRTTEGEESTRAPLEQRFEVSADRVRGFETGFAMSGFTLVTADPRALSNRAICYDGQEHVFEAYLRERYRFVTRRTCDPDYGKVVAWGANLSTLDPSWRRPPLKGC